MALMRFGAFNPRMNLPSTTRRKRGESSLVSAFIKQYTGQQLGVGGREFPMSGFGIADLIWINVDDEIGHFCFVTLAD